MRTNPLPRSLKTKEINEKAGTRRYTVTKGFTLLEMVMVMAIIGVLAGGVITLMGGFGESARIQRAETDMQGITSALMSYRALAGRYPTSQQGISALVEKPTLSPKPRRYPPKGFMKSLPKDPWGEPYVYLMPGSKDATTFELISFGADQKEGGGDDLSSQDKFE